MNPLVTEISKLIGGGLASVGIWQLVLFLVNKRGNRAAASKVEAEAVQIVSAAAKELVEPLRQNAKELEQRLKTANRRAEGLEEKLASAQAEVQQLRTQMDRMTKDLVAAHEELARLKGEPWPRTP